MPDESNSESPTDFLSKNSPLLLAALRFIFKELRLLLYAGIAYYLAVSGEHKDVKWLGSHISDKQAEIEQLEHSK
jgi:hypothetical protein